jgi:hypothetical protein
MLPVYQAPLKFAITRRINQQWLDSLRWLNAAHYEFALGQGGLRGNYRVVANSHFLCHLIPSALPVQERQELFRLSLAVARNRASGTRRLKNVGGGKHRLTKAGTLSLFAQPRKLAFLRSAKEGVFGFEGDERGRCGGPCAFNIEQPAEYGELVKLSESVSELARTHEPQLCSGQSVFASANRSRIIGNTLLWSQGIANLNLPMATHRDRGNVRGSLSALTVFGDFEGGPLIFPAYALAVFMAPGDLLLFDGQEAHGVGPFKGVRLSLVLYLKRSIEGCGVQRNDSDLHSNT